MSLATSYCGLPPLKGYLSNIGSSLPCACSPATLLCGWTLLCWPQISAIFLLRRGQWQVCERFARFAWHVPDVSWHERHGAFLAQKQTLAPTQKKGCQTALMPDRLNRHQLRLHRQSPCKERVICLTCLRRDFEGLFGLECQHLYNNLHWLLQARPTQLSPVFGGLPSRFGFAVPSLCEPGAPSGAVSIGCYTQRLHNR